MSDRRTTYARAAAGYDDEFEKALTEAIFRAITDASRVTGANAICQRTAETMQALLKTFALFLALSPFARSPTTLRTEVDAIAKHLRALTRQALDDPGFQDSAKRFFHGDDVGGHA